MQQLSFDFPAQSEKNPYLKEEFIVASENKAAFNFLEKFFEQSSFRSTNLSNQKQELISKFLLSGKRYCGKTHLMHIFCQKYANITSFITEEELEGINLNNFFQKNYFYILEDIEKIKNQELLLHIINCALENCSFLILTSCFNSGKLNFEIKDLNSRIKNIFNLAIEDPKKDLIKILLIKNFSKRQLVIDSKLIDFIKDNLSKSYEAICNIVKIIEFYCQENRQKPSLALVDHWLKNISYQICQM